MSEIVKHTPGPWNVEGPDWYGDFNIVPSHEALAIGAVVRNGMRDQGETEANARLISAAPDLLEALRELFATVKGECPRLLDEDRGANPHLYSSIVDAIAKAEGR